MGKVKIPQKLFDKEAVEFSKKNKSIEELAERYKELGYPISISTVKSKLNATPRGLSVANGKVIDEEGNEISTQDILDRFQKKELIKSDLGLNFRLVLQGHEQLKFRMDKSLGSIEDMLSGLEDILGVNE